MSPVQEAVLRTLCFHAAWEHAPTLPELVSGLDVGPEGCACSSDEVAMAVQTLMQDNRIAFQEGRYGLPEHLARLCDLVRERDILQPRKRRVAQSAVRLLARMRGVRFVALANTTALGAARDGGDLDLFVVAEHGTLWSARLLTAGPLRLMGKLPTADERPDAVCLSYFVSDRGLDLSSHMLDDDPYFRQWFLSLLPLMDDGIGEELWRTNAKLRQRHPFARRWMVPPDLIIKAPRLRVGLGRFGERLAESFQRRWFPSIIRERQNLGTDVIVRTDALKFHVDDRRAAYKQIYETFCTTLGLKA